MRGYPLLNAKAVADLARGGFTWEMIAVKLETTPKMLETFRAAFDRGRVLFQADLHEEQMNALKTLKGNAKVQLATFLGKQHLGQSDKIDQTMRRTQKPDREKVRKAFDKTFDRTNKVKGKIIKMETG